MTVVTVSRDSSDSSDKKLFSPHTKNVPLKTTSFKIIFFYQYFFLFFIQKIPPIFIKTTNLFQQQTDVIKKLKLWENLTQTVTELRKSKCDNSKT